MPPVSEKQRRAMFAAREGHSTLGIPKEVGEEFVGEADDDWSPEAREAAAKARHASGTKSTHGKGYGLKGAFAKHMAAKAASQKSKHNSAFARADKERHPNNPERGFSGLMRPRSEDGTDVAYSGDMLSAAGIMFVTPEGNALFLQRSDEGDHAGEWCFPGGHVRANETPEYAARREAIEEVGYLPSWEIALHDHSNADGVEYSTFKQNVEDEFTPQLNGEHTAHVWAPLAQPPKPLHPGVERLLKAGALAADIEWNEADHPRNQAGEFSATGYHGSPNRNLTEVSANTSVKQFDNGTSALGAFFAPNKEGAVKYKGENGRLYKADLHLKKPYEMPVSEFLYLQDPTKDAERKSLPGEKWGARLEELKVEGAKLRKELEAEGHDGVIIRNSRGVIQEIASFKNVLVKPHSEQAPDAADQSEINGVEINAEYDVPEMSCMSKDGKTMYYHRGLPREITNNGKPLDPCQPLLRHEVPEWTAMRAKVAELKDGKLTDEQKERIYLDAHERVANPSEKKWIEDNGYDYREWQDWCDARLEKLEHMKVEKPVPDADVWPIKHRSKRHDLELEEALDILDEELSFDTLAFDRESVRDFDIDGRMHIKCANISKANICPYWGREIPRYNELGLDPNKQYKLFRDPGELAKAAATFNSIQLLCKHVPVSADDHRPYDVIGTTGSDAEFVAPYLRNSLVIWSKDAIADIQSEEKKELSCGYRYRADMTPGNYQGEAYDGSMRDIVGNHVALVREGRAGHDVFVGDSQIISEDISMTKAVTLSANAASALKALVAHLKPALAKDGNLAGKLAKDASIDDVAAFLLALDEEPAALEPNSGMPTVGKGPGDKKKGKDSKKAKDSDDDEDDYEKKAKAEDDECQDPEGEDPQSTNKSERTGAKDKKKARDMKSCDEEASEMMSKDEALQAIDTAVKLARKAERDIRQAEQDVQPYVGALTMSFDSAEEVYRKALDILNVKHEGVHASALPTILSLVPKAGSKPQAGHRTAQLAADAKAAGGSFFERFPEAKRIRVMGA